MNITTISCGPLKANCYIVELGNESIIIDPGFPEKAIADYISDEGGNIRCILLTHGHFDHVLGVSYVKEKTGAPVFISSADEKGLYDDDFNMSNLFWGMYPAADKSLRADVLLEDGFSFSVGGTNIEVIATPGHSNGSVCFKIYNCLFSGDMLMKGSIGRTDFPGSDLGKMLSSIERLKLLDDSLKVYPGHGEQTILGMEKKYNPYFKY